MGVQTVGEAYQAGRRVYVRCAWGPREAMKSVRGCLGRAELDLHTLIWTRGSGFPLTSLEARLKCPMCGSRKVSVIFDVPSEPAAMRLPECRAASLCMRWNLAVPAARHGS
jgi:hypothetical protein